MKKIIFRVFLSLVVLLGIGAGGIAWSFTSSPIDPAAFPPTKRVVNPATGTARISLLPSGTISSKAGLMYRGGDFDHELQMPMTAILVEHEKGTYLFDAGLSTNGQQHYEDLPATTRAIATLTLEDSAKTRLDKVGRTSSLKGILLSHAHWDHVSGVEDFAKSLPVFVHPDEMEFARTHPMAELAQAIGHKLQPLPFDDGPYEMWSTSKDIFGDRSVVLVPLPGHTPGSMGLFVTTAQKRYFFIGDLVWSMAGLELMEERPWLASRVADVSPADVREQMVKTHRLMKLDPDLVVVPAHDEKASAAVPTWPAWTPEARTAVDPDPVEQPAAPNPPGE